MSYPKLSIEPYRDDSYTLDVDQRNFLKSLEGIDPTEFSDHPLLVASEMSAWVNDTNPETESYSFSEANDHLKCAIAVRVAPLERWSAADQMAAMRVMEPAVDIALHSSTGYGDNIIPFSAQETLSKTMDEYIDIDNAAYYDLEDKFRRQLSNNTVTELSPREVTELVTVGIKGHRDDMSENVEKVYYELLDVSDVSQDSKSIISELPKVDYGDVLTPEIVKRIDNDLHTLDPKFNDLEFKNEILIPEINKLSGNEKFSLPQMMAVDGALNGVSYPTGVVDNDHTKRSRMDGVNGGKAYVDYVENMLSPIGDSQDKTNENLVKATTGLKALMKDTDYGVEYDVLKIRGSFNNSLGMLNENGHKFDVKAMEALTSYEKVNDEFCERTGVDSSELTSPRAVLGRQMASYDRYVAKQEKLKEVPLVKDTGMKVKLAEPELGL